MKIILSQKIKEKCPEMAIMSVVCQLSNSASNDLLWQEIEQETDRITAKYALDEINKRPEIAATRKTYKNLGKDPNRYRPSAEALCRRIVRGIPLYKVNTLVDIINLVSIRSGFSIGGFDADKIAGNIQQGIGTSEEVFEAIGRGTLNIDGLPVYRDEIGGIGTPTSDNERTKISLHTTKILVIINGYSGKKGIETAANHLLNLLEKYADLKNHQMNWIE